jgi:hypothetical protein
MEKKAHPKVLLYQSAGFLAIIALSWIDEWLGLSTLIFGERPWFREFRQSALSMLLILAVWLLVATSTRRLLQRVQHLENFMRVCAWCRRIEYKNEWISFEKFLEQGFDTPTTHGICEGCLEQEKAALERALQNKSGIFSEENRAPG